MRIVRENKMSASQRKEGRMNSDMNWLQRISSERNHDGDVGH